MVDSDSINDLAVPAAIVAAAYLMMKPANDAVSGVGGVAGGVSDAIGNMFGGGMSAADGVGDFVGDVAGGTTDFVADFGNGVGSSTAEIGNSVLSIPGDTVKAGQDIVSGGITGSSDSNVIDKGTDALGNLNPF